jgi:glutamine synthetase
LYGRLVGKKYDSDYFSQNVFKKGSNACTYLLSCDMGFNPVPGSTLASYERGFGDFTMMPDIDSYREINYINDNRQLLLFSDLFIGKDPVAHAPRYMLRKAVEELTKLGVEVKVQCDINFMAFKENYKKIEDNVSHATPMSEHTNHYNTLIALNKEQFINKIKSSLKLSNVIVEHVEGSQAKGQFSLSLSSVEPMEFCDNITLLKLVKI